ncbi:MAG: efflux RND transporter permease subunit [Desulfatibacillaceae bacterium]
MADEDKVPSGFIARVVAAFLYSKLPVLFIVLAVLVGSFAVLRTPREEDPQIEVPMADIFVMAPGADAAEVEKLVATPLERLMFQLDGVEYVYSTSRRDMAMVTVRFYVGEDMEKSLVKLHDQITMHQDQVPPLVKNWLIKPVEIDDVPIVNITLFSEMYDDHELRRIGEEVLARLAEVEDISRTRIVGGRQREVRVEVDNERMHGVGVTMVDVRRALAGTDVSVTAGSYKRDNTERQVTSDSFLMSGRDVEDLVVGVHAGRPVYLGDVARVVDGPELPENYTRIGFSENNLSEKNSDMAGKSAPAVTLAISKKPGTNAVWVADEVISRMDRLQASVIPDGVRYEVTRNYGDTAEEKVNDLLTSLFFAIVTVVGLLAFALGWREALVVALAVPLSFAMALFVNFLIGYTINRVTLFALILSLGLVVDDPITNVDNIQRHILLGKRKPDKATLVAVDEVLPPVIMSTLAIIVSFAPMFFITGMMGPYMSPMAANVPLTVAFSTLFALSVVPWFSYHLLKNLKPLGEKEVKETEGASPAILAVYNRVVGPFLEHRSLRLLLALVVVLLLAGSASLALFRQVPLKMLPFDNKNEFQLVIDMPEGTPLEHTDRVVREFERYLAGVNEVTNVVSYVGEASPMDFNGMVRHYFLRTGGNLADIRVNLHDKKHRVQQSHEIALRLRRDLTRIASENNAVLQIVEVPPGPPVLATVVAEVYAGPDKSHGRLIDVAGQVRDLFASEDNLVDVDVMQETPRARLDFELDKEKAALHGVPAEVVAATLRLALSGGTPATVHVKGERQPLHVRIVLPEKTAASRASLLQIPVKGAMGEAVPLGELGRFREVPVCQPIYHKNLDRVVYVLGEMAGRAPAEAILDMQARLDENPLPDGFRVEWAGEGEWQITLRVFRDLGLAYLAAFVGIYILLVIQMNSFILPVLILVAIPLTFIGIMPGFWLFNMFFTEPVGSFGNPVFFTATSMIGMIALGGIVIRNSLVLVEFIQDSLARGKTLKDAILRSGAVRMRPIVLTAATTALGAWPITLDPIFSGLAWALIFGLFASTLFTLVVVPVTFYAANRRHYEKEERDEGHGQEIG